MNALYKGINEQLGVTDEVNTCSCCGKTNLQRTVVFSTTDEWQYEGGDEFVFLGTTCAQNATNKAIRQTKVNSKGQSQSDEFFENQLASMRIAIARHHVAEGATLAQVWGYIRRMNNDELILTYQLLAAS